LIVKLFIAFCKKGIICHGDRHCHGAFKKEIEQAQLAPRAAKFRVIN